MTAANESQGLKIAVAAFITLTVILAATSYFLYSSASAFQARFDFERQAHAKARRTADLALNQYDQIRTRLGTKAVEFDAANEEISAKFKNVDERLNSVMSAVNAAIETAQQKGAQGRELEDAKLKLQKAIASYRSEPNKNCISSLDRLTELIDRAQP
jgi:flagellin-like hook-associated protein FlgL